MLQERIAAQGEMLKQTRMKRMLHFLLTTGVNALSVSHAYMVMLLSMTFSLEIFGAIVLGLAFGRAIGQHSEQSQSSTLCCPAGPSPSRRQRARTITGEGRKPFYPD